MCMALLIMMTMTDMEDQEVEAMKDGGQGAVPLSKTIGDPIVLETVDLLDDPGIVEAILTMTGKNVQSTKSILLKIKIKFKITIQILSKKRDESKITFWLSVPFQAQRSRKE